MAGLSPAARPRRLGWPRRSSDCRSGLCQPAISFRRRAAAGLAGRGGHARPHLRRPVAVRKRWLRADFPEPNNHHSSAFLSHQSPHTPSSRRQSLRPDGFVLIALTPGLPLAARNSSWRPLARSDLTSSTASATEPCAPDLFRPLPPLGHSARTQLTRRLAGA